MKHFTRIENQKRMKAIRERTLFFAIPGREPLKYSKNRFGFDEGIVYIRELKMR